MELFAGATRIAQSDDFQIFPDCTPGTDCRSVTELLATGLDPCQANPGQPSPPANCTREAALLVTLPPGAYTGIVRGVVGATGVGFVEVNQGDLPGSVPPSIPDITGTFTGSGSITLTTCQDPAFNGMNQSFSTT